MTITIKHNFNCAIADDPAAVAAGEVVPSKWNDAHALASTDPDHAVVFVSGGTITASANLKWDDASKTLTFDNQGGNASIFGANGTLANPTGIGLIIGGGNAYAGSAGDGGSLSLFAGDGDGAGGGGSFSLSGGNTNGGSAGQAFISGGFDNGAGFGGTGSVVGGDSTSGTGGDCVIGPGHGAVANGGMRTQNIGTIDPLSGGNLYNDNGLFTFSGSMGAFLATAMQRYISWYPTTGTAQPTMIGCAVATATGTWSTIGGTNTNATTRQTRSQGATAASAGATIVYSPTGGRIFTGAAMLGSRTELLCAIHVNTTGHQCFFGLSSSVSALSGDPSARTDSIGVGYDAGDSSAGNWKFYTNDASGTATKVDTGIARNIDSALWIRLYNRPNSVIWDVTIMDINTGVTYNNTTISSNTPTDGVALSPVHLLNTGALTTAASMQLIGGFCKWVSS
jgi:hypothetical protein